VGNALESLRDYSDIPLRIRPITSLTDSTWNRRETYSVTKVENGISRLFTPILGPNPVEDTGVVRRLGTVGLGALGHGVKGLFVLDVEQFDHLLGRLLFHHVEISTTPGAATNESCETYGLISFSN
jgi:hypothetical protein